MFATAEAVELEWQVELAEPGGYIECIGCIPMNASPNDPDSSGQRRWGAIDRAGVVAVRTPATSADGFCATGMECTSTLRLSSGARFRVALSTMDRCTTEDRSQCDFTPWATVP